ncbi:aminodeoxychorismate lyase [uncultured Acinetobacter sp.]|uniref:aminodeoxychorismate lyase n=1 Tax=uncultured Acinetobacter sp. TaxID=165433 RepID=UPI002627B6C6|nr:aminodeoxychorismate lyase [uncultured Acinetobacter sp.]
MQCFKNAKAVSDIQLNDRAFHYGDGCFTTARIVEGQIEMQVRHIERLQSACQALQLRADLVTIPMTLAHLPKATGTLKIVISRGVGQRGYSLPSQEADVWLFFYPQPCTPFSPQLIQSDVLKLRLGHTMPALVGIKTLNRLEQVMLKAEADTRGLTEALVLDSHDYIVEGISSNCFLKLKDIWVTPELGYNGVHGIMRAEILMRMQQQGIACQQRAVHVDELAQLNSLFFCNALSAMKIVDQFAGQSLDSAACEALFSQLQLNQMT